MVNSWNSSDLWNLVLLNTTVFAIIAFGYFLYKKLASKSIHGLSSRDEAWKKVSQVLFQSEDLVPSDAIISNILKLVTMETSLDCAMLTRFHSANDMEVLFVHGAENPWSVGDRIGAQDSYCSRAVISGKPLCVEYAGVSEWRNHQAYKKQKIESYIGVQVYLNSRPFGVVSFFSKNSRGMLFSDAERNLVSTASKWLAIAMEKNQVSPAEVRAA